MAPTRWQFIPQFDTDIMSDAERATRLMNMGLESLRGIPNTVQDIQAADLARRREDVERQLAQRLSAAQTPDQVRDLLRSDLVGRLQSQDPSLVTPQMHQAVDARLNELIKRGQDSAKFESDMIKQGLDIRDLEGKLDQRDQRILASPFLAQRSELAKTDPTQALKLFEQDLAQNGIKLSTKDMEEAGRLFNMFYQDPVRAKEVALGWARHGLEREKHDNQKKAAALVQRVIPQSEEERSRTMLDADPMVAQIATGMLNQNAQGEFSREFYAPGGSLGFRATESEARRIAPQVFDTFDKATQLIDDQIRSVVTDDPIVASVAKGADSTESLMDVTTRITRALQGVFGKDKVSPDELHTAISKVRNGSKGPDGKFRISYATAGDLVLSQLQAAGLEGNDIVDGFDLKGWFNEHSNLERLGRSAGELVTSGKVRDYKKTIETGERIQELRTKLEQLAKKAASVERAIVVGGYREREKDENRLREQMDHVYQELMRELKKLPSSGSGASSVNRLISNSTAN